MTTKAKKIVSTAWTCILMSPFLSKRREPEDEKLCPECWKQQKWGAKMILIMKRNMNYYKKMLFKF